MHMGWWGAHGLVGCSGCSGRSGCSGCGAGGSPNVEVIVAIPLVDALTVGGGHIVVQVSQPKEGHLVALSVERHDWRVGAAGAGKEVVPTIESDPAVEE